MSITRPVIVRAVIGGAAVASTLVFVAGCSSSANVEQPTASATVVNGHNDQDVAFLDGMVAHHLQAIQMAQLVPSRTTNPQVRALAAKIQAAQSPEIAQMQSWLGEWSEVPAAESGHGMSGMDHGDSSAGAHSGPGMMSSADMAALTAKRGAAFDQMWLTMMIAHHEGAVQMSQTEIASGENARVKALAEQIVTAQTAEIAEMKQLLAS